MTLGFAERTISRSNLPFFLPPLAIFLAIQTILAFSVHIAQYDESIYLDVARNILRTGLPLRSLGANGLLLLDQTPLYPYFLSLLTFSFRDNLLLSRLVTALFGVGTVWLAFLIGSRWRGQFAGLIGALLVAINPFFNLYSFFIRMEVLMCFFVLLAVYLIGVGEITGRTRFFVYAGLAISAAVMLKVVAVTLLAAAVVTIFFRSRNWPDRLLRCTYLSVPSVVGIAIWMGMFLLEPGRIQQTIERWRGAVSEGAGIDPRLAVTNWPWLETVSGRVLGWGMVALLGASIIIFVINRHRRDSVSWLLLMYIGFTIMASLLVQLKEPRHVIGLIPAAAVFSGLVIDWAALWTSAKKRPTIAALALLAGLVFVLYQSPIQIPARSELSSWPSWWDPNIAWRMFWQDPGLEPAKEIGEYLSKESTPDAIIAVARQGPVVGYYADRSYLILYTETLEKNLENLKSVDYVVLDSEEFWQQSPAETEQLLEYIHRNFEEIYTPSNEMSEARLYHRIGQN